ncbi:hypothetical protein DJ030_06070 [bacterium endosymbiont of Escarpia laminata]|nr:MAG: hypothetical protein DJ030_06070 [bacterium endosymbiont of Escarpia laminata]
MLMNRGKNLLAIALLGSLPMAANATNGDQVLGVTATQWGTGGAVVVAPQDTGTLLTNPAGIAELGIEEVRFDLSPGFLNPPREVNDNESNSTHFFMPSGIALSLGMTRKLTDRISGSFSYTHAFENELTSNTGSGNTLSIEQNIVYLQLSYAL